MPTANDTPQLVHAVTVAALVIHVVGGAVGLVAGSISAATRKGGRVHRASGQVFVASMIVMAVFAIYLGFVIPDQKVNVFIGAFALYLVATGWIAARRPDGPGGRFEVAALILAIVLCAPFTVLSFQLATGLTPLFTSAVPFKGPVRIAIYTFTTILALAVAGDARVVFGRRIHGVPRLARHLWRMCLGLALAAGSGFTNGFARLLPGPYHVPAAFFLPQFIPVALLVYWLIRVRTAGGLRAQRSR